MALKKEKAQSNGIFFATLIVGMGALAALCRFLAPYLPWIRQHKVDLIIAGAAVAVLIVLRFVRKYRIASSLTEIDAMNGHEFERFLARLFKRLGYRTRVVGAKGADFGADLVLEKDGVAIAVQAKNYDTGKVGNDAVQQAIAGATYYNCDAAMVVTNAVYTRAALEQARGCSLIPVTLWNRHDLEKVLSKGTVVERPIRRF